MFECKLPYDLTLETYWRFDPVGVSVVIFTRVIYAALVDIAMPDMDGYEAARRLRELLPGILLIAVTGLVQNSDRVRVREAGFNYHIAKPASASQIEELLAISCRWAAATSRPYREDPRAARAPYRRSAF